jgi:hypothetical protein
MPIYILTPDPFEQKARKENEAQRQRREAAANRAAQGARVMGGPRRATTEPAGPGKAFAGLSLPLSPPMEGKEDLPQPSLGQGDFDDAIRELRSGLRRKRTERHAPGVSRGGD